MPGMRMNDVLQFLDHEDRCIRVVLLIFTVIQVLLLSALLLPEDPVILDIQPYPSSAGELQVVFTSTDAAPQDVKNANVLVPADRIGADPRDNNISENEDRVAAEPTYTITNGDEGMDPTGTDIISRVSHEVVAKPDDQPAASGIGIKSSDRTTVGNKEEYEFVPFPDSNRVAEQTQTPNVIRLFGEKATTADKEKPANATVPRVGQGWKDTIAGRFFKYGVAAAKVNRPKPSAANDLGEREALPAMNGLALLPLLDRLYWAAQRERVRTAPVASAAAAAAAVQALAVACPLLLLLLKAKYCG